MLTIPFRLHLFEFCDQKWLSGIFREAYMDCLNAIHYVFNPYKSMPEIIKYCAEKTGSNTMLDLCTGGCEHLRRIMLSARASNHKLPTLIASDLYPELSQYSSLKHDFSGSVDFIETPTSIEQVPLKHKFISIFTALHHFKPETVFSLFKDVVQNRDAILIAEFNRRTVSALLSVVFGAPLLLLVPLLNIRTNQRWLIKFVFTSVIPVIPILVAFDGVVSCLRCYTHKEIESVFKEAMLSSGVDNNKPIFEFKTGYRRSRIPLAGAAYFYAVRIHSNNDNT